MNWQNFAFELTRERNCLSRKERADMFVRGAAILISGVLFCASFAAVGVPIAGVGAMLIRIAAKQPSDKILAKFDIGAVGTRSGIAGPECRSEQLTQLSVYIDCYSATPVENPSERVHRSYDCVCAHGFTQTENRTRAP